MTVFGWRAATTSPHGVGFLARALVAIAVLAGCAGGGASDHGTVPDNGGDDGGGTGGDQAGTGDSGGGETIGGGIELGTSADDDDDDGAGGGDPLPPPSDGGEGEGASDSAAFKTSESREKMSEFLVKPAQAAVKKRDSAQAITYYRALTVARGAGSAEARELATVLTLAGKPEDARRVLGDYLRAATAEKDALSEARDEYDRLGGVSDPFAKQIEPAQLDGESKEAFKRGRASYKKKNYADALFYFELGYTLAPDLPGFLRELGATYDRLGATDKKVDFYRRYLRRRPFGKNSDEIRKELGKEKGALSELSLDTSLPCDEVWMNGQRMPGKLPKKLTMAPGEHRVWCISWKYELLVKEQVKIDAGKDASLTFQWATFVNKLEKPYGRISVEHASSPGTMLDLGISSPEVGVLVPADGRALRVVLKDDTGTRQVERYIKLTPGQREVIKW
jgi:tetratricopeptide (TPR) repeat protein